MREKIFIHFRHPVAFIGVNDGENNHHNVLNFRFVYSTSVTVFVRL